MEPIPHTQHCPICVRADAVIMAHPTPFSRHFNLRRAAWNGYSAALEMRGGCITNYIPGLSDESMSMYEDYKKSVCSDPFDNSTIETGDALMNTMK